MADQVKQKGVRRDKPGGHLIPWLLVGSLALILGGCNSGSNPGQAQNLVALSGFNSIMLEWEGPTNGAPTQGYAIYRGLSVPTVEKHDAYALVSAGVYTFLDENPVNYTGYYYRVVATTNHGGAGVPSNSVWAMARDFSQQVASGNHPTPIESQFFSLSVAMEGSLAVAGGTATVNGQTGTAVIYEQIAPGEWSDVAILRAADGQSVDYFGYTVDVSGGVVVVGAINEDGGPSDPLNGSGAAYIFEIDADDIWRETALLRASNAQASDTFGYSVSIDGDILAVSALSEDGPGDLVSNAGAVYVFERQSDGSWLETAILRSSESQAGDQFGLDVAVDGDRILVSAPAEDGGVGDPLTAAGAAYLFEKQTSGSWLETALLRAPDAQASDTFGQRIALEGDWILISAHLEDGGLGNPLTDAGAVYVFERQTNGAWLQSAVLRSSDLSSSDWFGFRVSLSAPYAVVGAPHEDGGTGDPAADSGAVYVFEFDPVAGTWSEISVIRASDGLAGDQFGRSVANFGAELVLGAPYQDGPSAAPVTDTGSVYFY